VQGGVIDEDEEAVTRKLATIIQHLSGELLSRAVIATYRASTVSFLDPQKATEDLQSFAKMNDRGLYKLLKTCMDTQSDLRALVKATVSSKFNP
jgi:sister-chromatid-cohesion protein PDS5